MLRFTYQEQDLGIESVEMAQVEPDLYLLSGNHLYLPGPWQIDVVIRRQGLEDTVAQFDWSVPPSEALPPPIISDRPWEKPLTTVAALLLGGVLVTAVLGRSKQPQ
jgi:hypothetical protein